MSKRDTYRDDWDKTSRDQAAQRQAAIQAHDMRALMMPTTYSPRIRVHGRLKPRG